MELGDVEFDTSKADKPVAAYGSFSHLATNCYFVVIGFECAAGQCWHVVNDRMHSSIVRSCFVNIVAVMLINDSVGISALALL